MTNGRERRDRGSSLVAGETWPVAGVPSASSVPRSPRGAGQLQAGRDLRPDSWARPFPPRNTRQGNPTQGGGRRWVLRPSPSAAGRPAHPAAGRSKPRPGLRGKPAALFSPCLSHPLLRLLVFSVWSFGAEGPPPSTGLPPRPSAAGHLPWQRRPRTDGFPL